MRSVLCLLMISLLFLAGCNNQALESTKQSVSGVQQVKINLGDGSSSRYKGNYNDVLERNGGSVVLRYSFPSSDNITVELQANMFQSPTGDWTVNLTLATGQYTFWADAYNKDGLHIFETDTPRTYSIDLNETSLNLGLQLNPILEDVSGTPMPLITQLSKPSGYLPGTQIEIGFTAKGGQEDLLEFFADASIPGPDNSSDSRNVGNYFASTDLSPIALDNISIYQASIAVDIPADATGPLTVVFGVSSETLQSGSYLQFTVNQAVNVSGSGNNTLVFVPTVDEFWLGADANDNGSNLLYYFEISGNQGFMDNVSFQFENSLGDAQVLPEKPSYPDERTGTLYRSVMDPGTLTITFSKDGGKFKYSYDYYVPGVSATQISTYIPTLPSDYESVPSLSTLNGVSLPKSSPGMEVSDNFSVQGESRSYKLEIRDGTALYVKFDDSSVPAHVNIENDSGSVNRSQIFHPGNGSGMYLPAGYYTMEVKTLDNGLHTYGHYSAHIYYEDTNVIRAGSQESPTEWQPSKVGDYWPDNTTKRLYDVYIGHGQDRQLKFTQANSRNISGDTKGNVLNFCLTDGSSTWGSCDGQYPGDMGLKSNSKYAPAPGWYTLEVMAVGADGPFNGFWAAYETGDNITHTSFVQTPDNFTFDLAEGADSLWLHQDKVVEDQTYLVRHNCDSDIVIHTSSAVQAIGYMTSSQIPVSSEGSAYEIRSNDCVDPLALILEPSEDTIHFGIQLETSQDGKIPNPPGNVESGTEDKLSPVITNLSLASDTVATGESLAFDIEASDDVSGVGHISFNARIEAEANGPGGPGSYLHGSVHVDHENDSGVFTGEIQVDTWDQTGDWIINYLNINDRADKYNGYSYSPNISETHYVRGYSQYDNDTGQWNYLQEESDLLLVRFTVVKPIEEEIKGVPGMPVMPEPVEEMMPY